MCVCVCVCVFVCVCSSVAIVRTKRDDFFQSECTAATI